MHVIRKNTKTFKFDWKSDFYENSINCIFYQITQGLEIVLKINQGKKMNLLLPWLACPYPMEQG